MAHSLMRNVLVTGGAGFIGSNFIRSLFADPVFTGNVINMDKLTYAGNLENLLDINALWAGKRYFFINACICDSEAVQQVFNQYEIDTVVHFAAESHVDRSIYGPSDFIKTNIIGTFNLLETARTAWKGRHDVLFHHVSTDEVYGSLDSEGYFYEHTPYSPRSPYSASKAASDHLVMAYWHTYGLPVTMSNCSNNYGPYQFPEKFLPLMILNMLEGKPLPLYGDGSNIRDWLHVADHCSAVQSILQHGTPGETYNIGGENEWQNKDLLHLLCLLMSQKTGKPHQEYLSLIKPVPDRPGHDLRYAINCDKLKQQLGWEPAIPFEDGLSDTIDWYLNNLPWIESIRSGAYQDWVKQHYDTPRTAAV